MQHDRVDPVADLGGFFMERVREAERVAGASVSEAVVMYVSDLLTQHTRAADAASATLAEQHVRACGMPGGAALPHWQRLGDDALLLAGWYERARARRGVSFEYVASLGSAAYHRAHGCLARGQARGRASDPAPAAADHRGVFEELGEGFVRCVRIVACVRQALAPDDVGSLCETWLRERSELALARLRARGVLLTRGASDV
jgi:hypothetical protein